MRIRSLERGRGWGRGGGGYVTVKCAHPFSYSRKARHYALSHSIVDDEEAIEKVAHKEVERRELDEGAEEGLVRARARPRDEHAVGPENDLVVL
jgi:hypothetical protein